MLKIKSNKGQKLKQSNQNMKFILGIQSSNNPNNKGRQPGPSGFSKPTVWSSSLSSPKTLSTSYQNQNTQNHSNNNNNNDLIMSRISGIRRLSPDQNSNITADNTTTDFTDLNESILPAKNNNNNIENALWKPTTISAVPPLVTEAHCRAVLAKKNEYLKNKKKTFGWSLSSSGPAYRGTPQIMDETGSSMSIDDDGDIDRSSMEEVSSYFATTCNNSSQDISNQRVMTRRLVERTPIRTVLNAIQGPPTTSGGEVMASQSNNKIGSVGNHVLQSPWVTRASQIPSIVNSSLPEESSRYSVKEMLDFLCPSDIIVID